MHLPATIETTPAYEIRHHPSGDLVGAGVENAESPCSNLSLFLRLYCSRVELARFENLRLHRHLQKLWPEHPRPRSHHAGHLDRGRVPALWGPQSLSAARHLPRPLVAPAPVEKTGKVGAFSLTEASAGGSHETGALLVKPASRDHGSGGAPRPRCKRRTLSHLRPNVRNLPGSICQPCPRSITVHTLVFCQEPILWISS